MVNFKAYIIYFNSYLSANLSAHLYYSFWSFFIKSVNVVPFLSLFLISLQLFYVGYDAPTFSQKVLFYPLKHLLTQFSHNNHINSYSLLQWSSSKDEWACIIHSGFLHPTQEVRKAILAATTTDKGTSSLFSSNSAHFQFNNSSFSKTNIFPLCPDADKQPADSLSRVAAFNVEEVLLKSSETSRGAIFNIHETLIKEWGPESIGSIPDDHIQELLIEVRKPIWFIIILYLLYMLVDKSYNFSFPTCPRIRFNIILLYFFSFRVWIFWS